MLNYRYDVIERVDESVIPFGFNIGYQVV